MDGTTVRPTDDVLEDRPHLARLITDAASDRGVYTQTEISGELEPPAASRRAAMWRDAGLHHRYGAIVRDADFGDAPHSASSLCDECMWYLRLIDRRPRLVAHLLSTAWHPGGGAGIRDVVMSWIEAGTGAGPIPVPSPEGIYRAARVIAWARGRYEVVPRDLRLAAVATITEDLWAATRAVRSALLVELLELRELPVEHVEYARTAAWMPAALVPRHTEPWERDGHLWTPREVPALRWRRRGNLCARPDSRFLLKEADRLGRYDIHLPEHTTEPVSITELCAGLTDVTWDALFQRAVRLHRARTSTPAAHAGGSRPDDAQGEEGDDDPAEDKEEDQEEDRGVALDDDEPWPGLSNPWGYGGGNPLGIRGAGSRALRALEERASAPPREEFRRLRDGLRERVGHAIVDQLAMLALLHIRGQRSPRVLLTGPPGVGKTHCLRALAEVAGVPVHTVDTTEMAETSYRGITSSELASDLVTAAHGSVELASRMIVLLDEIDKIRVEPGDDAQSRSKRRGQQTALLTLLGGQTPMTVDGGKRGRDGTQLRTERMMVVCAGAFADLEFRGDVPSTADLVGYGIMPEIADRIQHRLRMRPRGEAETLRLLKSAEGGAADVAELFAELGLTLTIAEETYRYAARRAVQHGISPRESIGWLRQAAERLLLRALTNESDQTEWVLTPDDLTR